MTFLATKFRHQLCHQLRRQLRRQIRRQIRHQIRHDENFVVKFVMTKISSSNSSKPNSSPNSSWHMKTAIVEISSNFEIILPLVKVQLATAKRIKVFTSKPIKTACKRRLRRF